MDRNKKRIQTIAVTGYTNLNVEEWEEAKESLR